MSKIDTKIKKMIDSSIFLDGKRKKRLLRLCEGLDNEQKHEILIALKKEKEVLFELIGVFVKNADPAEVKEAGNILLKGKKLVLMKSEKTLKKGEEQLIENVLSEIDNLS